jgi:hypothetical protein
MVVWFVVEWRNGMLYYFVYLYFYYSINSIFFIKATFLQYKAIDALFPEFDVVNKILFSLKTSWFQQLKPNDLSKKVIYDHWLCKLKLYLHTIELWHVSIVN